MREDDCKGIRKQAQKKRFKGLECQVMGKHSAEVAVVELELQVVSVLHKRALGCGIAKEQLKQQRPQLLVALRELRVVVLNRYEEAEIVEI